MNNPFTLRGKDADSAEANYYASLRGAALPGLGPDSANADHYYYASLQAITPPPLDPDALSNDIPPISDKDQVQWATKYAEDWRRRRRQSCVSAGWMVTVAIFVAFVLVQLLLLVGSAR